MAVDVGLATAEHGLTDQAIGWQPMDDVEMTGGSLTNMTTVQMTAGYTPSADGDLMTKKDVETLVGGSGLPINTIVQWYGTAATVPSGWAICDGTSGTPDLRNRFIKGSSIDGDQGTTGGAAQGTTSSNGSHTHAGMTVNGTVLTEAQLPTHTHGVGTLTMDSVGDHNHLNFIDTQYTGNQNNLSSNEAPVSYGDHNVGDQYHYNMTSNNGSTAEPTVGKSNTTGAHNHTLSGSSAGVGSGQSHTHGINTQSDGSHTHTVDTEPSYMMLYFIMRIS
jgi:hypothetical protein